MARRTSFSCFHCYARKPRECFPMGRAGTRHTLICWGCLEARAYGLDAKRSEFLANRRTWRDPDSHQLMRRCLDCEKAKQLRRFPKNAAESHHHGYRCFLCARKLNGVLTRKRKADPEGLALDRAYKRKASRSWRERNPERYMAQRERMRERTKKRWAAEPELRIRHNENQRMRYHLKREREGRPVKMVKKVAMISEGRRKLPAAPLAAVVNEKIEQRQRVDRVMRGFGVTSKEEICEEFGLEPRTLYRWCVEEIAMVQIGTAERIAMNIGVAPEEVWPAGEFPRLYAEDGPLAIAA